MNPSQERQHLRAILNGTRCLHPASVYDALSARIAESVGFEVGLLSGSVVCAVALAAPDVMVQTATEYAAQIRSIMRASSLSLLVDADDGYGNALNVMRTVEEFEHAGVSALSIEDSAGLAFGQSEDEIRLVSIEEGVGKMRAALAARRDPALVIVARTPAFRLPDTATALARVKAYAAAGVDAICISGGAESVAVVRAAQAAARLPLIIGSKHGGLTLDQLGACGARIVLQGHAPVAAAVRALHDTYTHLYNGGAPASLRSKTASPQEMERLVQAGRYQQWLRDYLR